MGFLPVTTKTTKTTEDDRIRADALHGAIARKLRRRTGWSRNKWADEFRRLRESFTDSAEGGTRIKNTLAWYIKNVGGEYVPVVACAKSFRTKFDRLEAAMLRHQRDQPGIEVSEVAESIAKRQSRKNGWPKGSKDQLPHVVQMSLNNAEDFLKRLGGVKERRLREFAVKVKSKFAGGVESFVDRWMDKVHSQVANWDDWSGNLKPWAFSPTHKMFVSMGRGWSQEYSNGTKLWSLLMEETTNG